MAKQREWQVRRTKVKSKTAAEPSRVQASGAFADEVNEAARAAAEKRSQRSRRPRTRRRLIILGIMVLLVLVVWLNWDKLNPTSVWNWLSVTVTGGETGDGYPTQVEGSTVARMAPTGNYLAVLTDNTLTVYNRTAGVVMSRTHNFATPLFDTAGGKMLIAELGGRRIRIESVGGQTTEFQMKQNIVDAALAKDGSFAVVTESDKSHISEVVYYNKRGEEKLHWYSSEALIVGLDLKADGRQMAAVGVLSENGGMQSRLLVFNTSSADEPQKYSGEDVMLCAVEYLEGGHIAAIGDTAMWVVTPGKEEIQTQSYSDMQLLGYAVSDRQAAVALRNYGANVGGQLLTVDQNGKEKYNQSFEGTFRDLSAGNRGFLLLTEGMLTSFDRSGKTKTAEVSSDGLMTCEAFGNKTMVLGLTTLTTCEPKAE